jgi:hypothetical protein
MYELDEMVKMSFRNNNYAFFAFFSTGMISHINML